MSVSLLLAGFNRSLSVTWPGILSNVIEPMEEFGIEVELYGAISRSKELITNTWSKEVGYSEWEVPNPERYSALQYFDQEEIDLDMQQMYELAKSVGDPWPEVSDNFASLRNHMRLLYLLKAGYNLFPKETTAVFFLRPDLLPVDRLNVEKYFHKSSSGFITETLSGVTLPSWQHWTGLNDRVAIISRPYWRKYLCRFDDIPDRVANGYAIHSETYLKHCLRDAPVHPIMDEFFARVRVNGEMSTFDARYIEERGATNE